MNELLNKADPHLSAIRIACLSIQDEDYDMGRQIGSARFNLYKAIGSGDIAAATGWLNTLSVGLGCLRRDGHPAADSVGVALAALGELLGAPASASASA